MKVVREKSWIMVASLLAVAGFAATYFSPSSERAIVLSCTPEPGSEPTSYFVSCGGYLE